MFLATVFAGVLSGIAIGLVFAVGGSGGGGDITAKIIVYKHKDLNLSKVLLIQDIAIYVLVGIILGPTKVMYAVIMSYIRTITVDTVQDGLSSMKQCMIVCDSSKAEEIVTHIFNEVGRGATIFDGQGAYTKSSKKAIYIIVLKHELSAIKNILKNIDKTAFLTVSPVNSIQGNFKSRDWIK
jgi:uncharacterized membrane-anchored protein YitT (DUF2179 family)